MAKVLRMLLIVIVVAGAAGAIYAWVGSHGTDENGNTLVEAEIGSITEKALAKFGRLRRAHTSVLAQREPFVLPKRNFSRGRRALYMVQIGADSRKDARDICAALRKDGGACIVQKN